MLKVGDMMRVDRGVHMGIVGRLVQIRGDETFELEARGGAIVVVPGRHCVAEARPDRGIEEWYVRPAPLGREEVVDRDGLLVARCDSLDADLIAAAPRMLAILHRQRADLGAADRDFIDQLQLSRESCPACKGTRETDDDECGFCLGRGTVAIPLPSAPKAKPKAKKRRP